MNYAVRLEIKMEQLKRRMDEIDRKRTSAYEIERKKAEAAGVAFDLPKPEVAEVKDEEDVALVKEWINWHCFKKHKKLKMRSCLKLLKNKYNINAERTKPIK